MCSYLFTPRVQWCLCLVEDTEMKGCTAVILQSVFTQNRPLMHVTHASKGTWYLVLSGLPCSEATVSTTQYLTFCFPPADPRA